MEDEMKIILLIALVSLLAMYLCYPTVCSFVRVFNAAPGEEGGKRRRRKSGGMVKMEMSSEQEKKIGFSILIVFMAAAFIARLIGAVVYRGYEVDINCFLAWANMIFENGIGNFYSLDAFTDYPPGYMYILYAIGALRAVFHIAQTSTLSIILTKMPAILADLAIGWLVYKIACKKFKETGAACIAGLFLLTPAVILDSAVWAQVDSVFTLCIVLMCYFLTEKKLIPAYFIFALGILIKPQSLIFTPVLIYGIVEQVFIESFRQDPREVFWKKFWLNLGCGIAAILCIGLLMLPFGFHDALSQYTETLGSYPYASVNAYNFWTMIGRNWAPQEETLLGIAYQTWGMISIFATVIFSGIIFFKSKDSRSKYYFTAALIVTCVFTLSVRMHERYIYPAVILLLLCFAARPRKKLFNAFIFMAFGTFLNMAHSMFYFDPNNFDNMASIPIFIGCIMVAVLIYVIYLAVACYAGYASESVEHEAMNRELQHIPWKQEKDRNIIQASDKPVKFAGIDFILMAAITLIYAVVAFSNLGDRKAPETEYSVLGDGDLVLDFGKEVQISKIWNFLGYANNPKYLVYYSNTGGDEDWTDCFTEESPLDAGSVFHWNDTSVDLSARYLWITPSEQTYEDSIMEMAFTDPDGNVLLDRKSVV